MQPILPTTNAVARPGSAPGATAALTPTPLDLARNTGRGSSLSGVTRSTTTGLLSRDVQDALGQLLGGVSGSSGSDKLLQMMIALLILLTLLEQANGADARSGGAMASQLPQSSGQGSFIMMSATSTTISIEQTSVYLAATTDPAMLTMPDGSSPAGNQVDLSA